MGQTPYHAPQIGSPVPIQQQPLPLIDKATLYGQCPTGLEYLTQLNQILVKQELELKEAMSNIQYENRYSCYDSMEQRIYTCREESDYCTRQCCSNRRPFAMHVEDSTGREVIRIDRTYKCMCFCQCCSCIDCCLDEVTVEAPIGQVVGYVKQIWQCSRPEYIVMNSDKDVVLRIRGPYVCKPFSVGTDIPFKVLSKDGIKQVGAIVNQWSDPVPKYRTGADNFVVTFPGDLDLPVKATLIGAVFLIDFMYFEQYNPRKRGQRKW